MTEAQKTATLKAGRQMTVPAIRHRFEIGNWNREDLDWLFAHAEVARAGQIGADQIRQTKFECDSGEWETAKWLRSIAAELRDFNDTLTMLYTSFDRIANTLEGGKPPKL